MKKRSFIIPLVIVFVVLAAALGVQTFFMIKAGKEKDDAIKALTEQNEKLEEFVEKNFSVDIDEWDGTKVALTEKRIISVIKNAMEEYSGVDTSMLDDAETLEDLIAALEEGEFGREVHEIYDDTAVVEAYKNNDDSGLSDEDKYVLETASKVIDEVIEDGMTDYEKELAIYNWQFNYVRYDESHFSPIPTDEGDNYTPYGVFKTHEAICVGNATTFKLFMDMLDIDCMIIHSTEEGEHAWNLVCLDGDWYHVDLTFDGGSEEPDYAYFNVPDSFKLDDGYPWDTSEFPAAEGTRYTYVFKNSVEVSDIKEIPALVKERLDNGGGNLFIRADEELPGFEAVVERISNRLSNRDDVWVYSGEIRVADDTYIYEIDIEVYDDDWGYDQPDDTELSDEMKELIDGMF